MRMLRAVVIAVVCLGTAWPVAAQSRTDEHWAATWGPSMIVRGVPGSGRGQGPAPGRGAAPPLTFNNQTLRQIARVTLGGERLRVTISNVFGTAPLRIGAAHAAVRACADAQPGCQRSTDTAIASRAVPLTVSGHVSFTVPPGVALLTDPIDLTVPSLSDLVVDLYLPDDWSANTVPLTYHPVSVQTTYVSTEGNFSGASEFPVLATPANWFFLSRIDVVAPRDTRMIVALGDSITDGAQSTLNTNRRWPDVLARRLMAEPDGRPVAVINAGISGNRLLTDGSGVSALARFDRDVLSQPGITHLILFEGINDIGLARANPTPTVDDLVMAHRQLIARARSRGIRVIGATLAPIEGAFYFTPEGEAKRQAFNTWIRTSGEFDGVIDFDALTRDPDRPSWLLPANDSGDHLHPSDTGYAAMGNGIDLTLFSTSAAGPLSDVRVGLRRHLEQYTGPNPLDCRSHLKNPLPAREAVEAAAIACVADAARQGKPFFAFDSGGLMSDSWIVGGLLSTADGSTHRFWYDSAPCGGPNCADRFTIGPCEAPSIAIDDLYYWVITCRSTTTRP